MKALLVYAHPDPNSLSAALRDTAVSALQAQGHEVSVSDLYAMKWKATADFDDFEREPSEPTFMRASGEACRNGTLTEDVRAEQRKLLEADVVILQFPLWWYSMPAILKGWVDRVFTHDFGYGSSSDWPRYGAGKLAGKRAMLLVAAGGGPTSFSDRGINGPVEDVLYPIEHGLLHYVGFDVLPAFVVKGAVKLRPERFEQYAAALRERMGRVATEPIAGFRAQDGGDYDKTLRLKPGLEPDGAAGFTLHRLPASE